MGLSIKPQKMINTERKKNNNKVHLQAGTYSHFFPLVLQPISLNSPSPPHPLNHLLLSSTYLLTFHVLPHFFTFLVLFILPPPSTSCHCALWGFLSCAVPSLITIQGTPSPRGLFFFFFKGSKTLFQYYLKQCTL